MSLPAPDLDDRTFDDLVREAMEKVRQQCPQWVDGGPSDPGRTLIEVMAWLAETVIYRLNRVPDKSYVHFLDLLGVRMRPASPARAWMVFEPKEGAKQGQLEHVPAGTPLEALPVDPGSKPLPFETLTALDPVAARVVGIFSEAKERVTVHAGLLVDPPEPAVVFGGEKARDHFLYLGDGELGADAHGDRRAGETLQLQFQVEGERGSVELEWECYVAEQWSSVAPLSDDTFGLARSGPITFELPVPPEKSLELDKEAFWLRARVVRFAGPSPAVSGIGFRFSAKRRPIAVITREAGQRVEKQLNAAQLPRPIDPFTGRAIGGAEMLLASPLFGRAGARITIVVRSPGIDPKEMADVRLVWEIWTGGGVWTRLGLTGPGGAIDSEHSLEDETEAFEQGGELDRCVRFTVPADPALLTEGGLKSFWVRVRIAQGRYGDAGHRGPQITELRVECEEPERPLAHVLGQDGGAKRDIDLTGEPAVLFVRDEGKDPIFALGLSEVPPANRRCSVLLRAAPRSRGGSLVWEYLAQGWQTLPGLDDGTRGLTQTGTIEFVAPPDWQAARLQERGVEAFWLRARWCMGDYDAAPTLLGVHMNAVEAVQAEVVRDLPLLSGSGKPGQRKQLDRPVLEGLTLLVREVDARQLQEVGETALGSVDEPGVEVVRTDQGVFTRWKEIDSLLMAGPRSRVFVMSPDRTEIRFGDGRLGMPPPPGSENVRIEQALHGGGAQGNVPGHAVLPSRAPEVRLLSKRGGIGRVYNPDAAAGGADAETLAEAKRRAPKYLRSRDRAVTAQDFEVLAKEASSDVARAKTVQMSDRISVVIVPKADETDAVPHPSAGLLRIVRDYLDARRLMNVELEVRGPTYAPVELESTITVLARYADDLGRIETRLKQVVRQFVHPLRGRDGQGWPMGRSLRVSELYHLLEQLAFVDYVDSIVLRAPGEPGKVDKVGRESVEVPPLGYPMLQSCKIIPRLGGGA